MENKKVKEPRDTVLVRIDRKIRDKVKELSQELNKRMSRIVDSALIKYIKSFELINRHKKDKSIDSNFN